MKIDFSKPILGLKGEEIKEDNRVVTLSAVCTTALLAPHESDARASGQEKAKRFKLAMVVADENEVEISVEDASLLKDLIGRSFAPLVVGRAYELLDPKG